MVSPGTKLALMIVCRKSNFRFFMFRAQSSMRRKRGLLLKVI